MGHRGAMAREELDSPSSRCTEAPRSVLARSGPGGVPLERTHAVLGERALDLMLGLVHVHVHRQVELGGERRHLTEGRVRDGIRRVRREAERNQQCSP